MGPAMMLCDGYIKRSRSVLLSYDCKTVSFSTYGFKQSNSSALASPSLSNKNLLVAFPTYE